MIKNFLKDETGQGMVEYGLMIALVGVVVIAALAAMGSSTANMIDGSADAVDNTMENGTAAVPDFSAEADVIVDSADTIVEQSGVTIGE